MTGSPAPQAPAQRRWLRDSLLVLIVLVSLLAAWHWVSPASSPLHLIFTRNALPAIPREHRPFTLDPATVSAPWQEGYRIAREQAALLERLACYCGCYLSLGHQNALDCFRDRHAEGCEVCLKIARRAEELEHSGYTMEEIKRLIDREFSGTRERR